MLDQNRKPGIGIGRGRGSLRNSNDKTHSNFEEKVLKSEIHKEIISINTSNSNSNNIIHPQKVTYIPNDDCEDYKLHVNSGVNFTKLEEVKVRVTGENIPPSISDLSDVDLKSFLYTNTKKLGFNILTPVQKHAIPVIMARRDVMACAETGSGKTAAFLIPILNKVMELKLGPQSKRNSPHCIVIVPSRELCRQLYTIAVELSKTSSISCSYGYGGIEMTSSLQKLISCDLLFSTPGRLLHYINSDIIILNRLSFLVLDEADKLLSVDSFHEAVQLVIKSARVINGRDLHISMFSATFPREIQNLAQKYLTNYLFIAVGIVGAANSDIIQTLLPVTAANKLTITLEYIANQRLGKTLIFVRRKRLADFYGIRLIEMGLTTTTIHGDRDQEDREIALNDFKSDRVQVLVATDVASRGLDIPHVDTVVNIDMPQTVDIYVHRIGRSGRCGNPGSAVSFFNIEEDYHLAPRLIQVLKASKQPCPDFLRQLGQGVKVNNYVIKSSMRDLRHDVINPLVDVASSITPKHFMNMTEDSDIDENEYG